MTGTSVAASNLRFLVTIATWTVLASFLFPLAVAQWLVWERIAVARRGKPGIATIKSCEVIRHLPSMLYELKLHIVPDDRSEIDFHMRVRWKRSEVDPARLTVGSMVPVRFRRNPRPLAMPS